MFETSETSENQRQEDIHFFGINEIFKRVVSSNDLVDRVLARTLVLSEYFLVLSNTQEYGLTPLTP